MELSLRQAFIMIASSEESMVSIHKHYLKNPQHYLRGNSNGRFITRSHFIDALASDVFDRMGTGWVPDLSVAAYRALVLSLKKLQYPDIDLGESEAHVNADWIAAVKGNCGTTTSNENKEKSTMSPRYSETPIAKPTFIFGQDTADMGEAEYLAAIRKLNNQIASYADIQNSKRVDNIVKDLVIQRDKIVALFDKAK